MIEKLRRRLRRWLMEEEVAWEGAVRRAGGAGWLDRGRERLVEIRAGSYVDPSAQFIGARRVEVGKGCVIAEDCWMNVNDWSGAGPALVIGDESFIGRRNFFTVGECLEIGAFCLTGPGVEILGADHGFEDPRIPYVRAAVKPGGRNRIGVNCWLGSRVMILKNVDVGWGSVIGAGAILRESVPPFSLVVGQPGRVLRRYSFARGAWVGVEEWTAGDEAAVPEEQGYLEQLRSEGTAGRMPLPAASSRFGDF